MPPRCQECKGWEREVERLQRRAHDLEDDLQASKAANELEILSVRRELSEACATNVLRAHDLLTEALTLVDRVLDGSERFPELEAPRLRRRAHQWALDNGLLGTTLAR